MITMGSTYTSCHAGYYAVMPCHFTESADIGANVHGSGGFHQKILLSVEPQPLPVGRAPPYAMALNTVR